MATRLYFDPLLTPGISPALGSGWELTSGVTRGVAIRNQPLHGAAAVALGVAETSASGTYDVAVASFLSPPIIAQTIANTGTITGQILCHESDLAANMVGILRIRVMSNDGATIRGYLAGTPVTFSQMATEFAASATNRSLPASMSVANNVSALDGDRLMIDLGYRATNTDATSFTGTLTVNNGSASDLPIDEADTTSANSWVEFSQDLKFMTPGSLVGAGEFVTDQCVMTTGSANANTVVTLPAVSGGLHAIKNIHIKRGAASAVGGSKALVIRSFNLPGEMSWTVGDDIAAGGTKTDVNIDFGRRPLLAVAPSCETLIAMPAAGVDVTWSASVTYNVIRTI